jgi:hypothetical protein
VLGHVPTHRQARGIADARLANGTAPAVTDPPAAR